VRASDRAGLAAAGWSVHIDSIPHRSAVVARCASKAVLLNGPELTNIMPSFIVVLHRSKMTRSINSSRLIYRRKIAIEKAARAH
jgi:hypothetical protein